MIRPRLQNPASREVAQGQGVPGKDPERTRSSQARRESTGSARTGRGQSPAPRTSDRSRTPDRARIPIRHQTPDREATQDKGKSHAHPATPTFPADCPMLEPLPTPPSRIASARDPRTASGGQHSEHPTGSNPALSSGIRRGTVSGTPGSRTPRAEETGDSEDEVVPSPNMRRALTRMQAKASPGSSSLVGGLDWD
jgi:hypothetical protein